MNVFSQQQGFSLVETLVAISILLLAIVGPMTIAAKALQTAQFSREQNTAFFLAQEGIEAVTKLRNEHSIDHVNSDGADPAWGWATPLRSAGCDTGCSFDFRDAQNLENSLVACTGDACRLYYDAGANRARYSHDTGGTVTPYTRTITIEEVSAEIVSVTSRVDWVASGTRLPKEVILQVYLHNVYDITNL